MCHALIFVHTTLNVIHRDVKPSNIFIKDISPNYIHTVLADFGLAKSNQNSINNSYAGTPLFMSPELGLGAKYYANTDTYSLGVTLFQLITKDRTSAISSMYFLKDEKEVISWLKKYMKQCGDYSDELINLIVLFSF